MPLFITADNHLLHLLALEADYKNLEKALKNTTSNLLGIDVDYSLNIFKQYNRPAIYLGTTNFTHDRVYN